MPRDDDPPTKEQVDRNWLDGLLVNAQTRKFYGKLVVSIEDGRIIRVVKEESLKPPAGK